MRVLGFEIKRLPANLQSPDGRGGWWPILRESFAGAWQQNVEVRADSVLAYHAVFACVTLISSDVGKLRPKLMEQDDDGIWTETDSPSFSPVLRRPNSYQNHIQFKEWWVSSKLTRGNSYALKQRDSRGVVTALYLLDPSRVRPLVAPAGEVYYELAVDNLSGIRESVTVPASEIIHDRMNCLYHPLVGLSPIYACGLAATQGLAAQNNSANMFQHGARPGGILTAPGSISKETAERVKAQWETNFGGQNYGRTAVLGDGLKFEPLSITPVDAQLIEQLKWSAEVVCSCFHVPPFKLGLGQMPTYQNAELLNSIYYSDCLQSMIEQFEICMDDGLGLDTPKSGRMMGVELDLDSLLRMDSASMIKSMAEGVSGGVISPNEARRRIDLKPVTGGESPFLQQQNYSLAALAKRDAQADPFGTAAPEPPAEEEEEEQDEPAAEPVPGERDYRLALAMKIEQRRNAA